MPVTIEGGNIFRLEEFLISRDGEEWFEVPVKTFIEQCADQSCLKPEDYQFYMDLRKYGSTRHSGFGLGFERCVMYLTGMGNIRDVIPFPRTVNNCDL